MPSRSIAAENNLAETAFILTDGDDYRLRWFTPAVEVELCGHATLASAAVVMERLEPARRRVVFHTRSGALTVQPTEAGYVMDFPARASTAIDSPPGIADALGAVPIGVFWDGFNYLVLLDQAATVRTLTPDIAAIARIARDGMIVTAQGDRDYDFTSRYFAPSKGIAEDPVTGGAHCALAPFWAGRLGKTVFRAYQASHRGGEVICRAKGQRVELEGSCVFYLEGMVDI